MTSGFVVAFLFCCPVSLRVSHPAEQVSLYLSIILFSHFETNSPNTRLACNIAGPWLHMRHLTFCDPDFDCASASTQQLHPFSGAGTNLKVRGAPVRSESGGGTDLVQSPGKIYLGCVPPLFGSKSTISRFGERVRDG